VTNDYATFAYAAIASIAFLACGTNNSTEFISASPSKDNCEIYEYLDGSGRCISEKGPEDWPPYDPENIPCDLGGGVKEWMEEQLAFGKNDRELFIVIDLLSPGFDSWPAEQVECLTEIFEKAKETSLPAEQVGCREGICYIDNREVDEEEYNKCIENFAKERAEKRRVSPMIGVFVMDWRTSGGDAWRVLMTAKEVVELTEKYKGLIINFPAKHGY